MSNLRKAINLFKCSDTDDDDRRYGRPHERLFPMVPLVPVLPVPVLPVPVPVPQAVPGDGSAIVAQLIQRTLVTAAQSILSTHTITVTTSRDTEPAKSLPVGHGDAITVTGADEEPGKNTSSLLINGPEVEQEYEDHNNGPTIDAKLETGSVDTPDIYVPETHEEL